MNKYIVSFFDGRDGDNEDERSFKSALQALKFAEEAGSGVTVTAPDGTAYHVSDFKIALDQGKLSDA